MAKPILIIRIPTASVNEMGKDKLAHIQRGLRNELDDYHVLMMSDSNVTESKFECFNVENLDAITIDELKKHIDKKIDQLK